MKENRKNHELQSGELEQVAGAEGPWEQVTELLREGANIAADCAEIQRSIDDMSNLRLHIPRDAEEALDRTLANLRLQKEQLMLYNCQLAHEAHSLANQLRRLGIY